jgi:hypothetical protein
MRISNIASHVMPNTVPTRKVSRYYIISVPNDKRSFMVVALFLQALDITDGIVILLVNNLSGPAFALARPMHEGYVLEHEAGRT